MVFSSYLSFVSYGLIPMDIIILCLLCTGIARKQVYYALKYIISASIDLNGIKLKPFSMFAVFSAIGMVNLYYKLGNLQQEKEDE